MAQRRYTYNDAPTKPLAWWESADAVYGADKRLTQWPSRGTDAGAALTPITAARAPLYDPVGYNGALPGVVFTASRFDIMMSSSWTGPNQPATVVYIWQTAKSSRSSYAVFADHSNTGAGDGGRQTLFDVYGGSTPSYLVNSASARVPLGSAANALGQLNTLVVEYNGTTSGRYWLNSSVPATGNFGTVLSGLGFALGGKNGDTPTAFGGAALRVAILPGLFTGDALDRIVQGSLWDSQQQSKIATGATYKDAAPMVDDATPAAITGSSASTLGGLGRAATAGLAIVGAASLALAGIGASSTASVRVTAQAAAPLGAIVSASAGSIAAAGAGAATLQSITSASSGALPVLVAGAATLGDVASAAVGSLPIASATSTTIDPIATVSAARADLRGAANTTLAGVIGSSTVGGQSLATASGASVLGSVSTVSAGSARVTGNGLVTLATIASNSGAAAAVRGAGAVAIGSIGSVSSASTPLNAGSDASLGGVQSDGRTSVLATGAVAIQLGAIVSAASASVGQDTDGQLVGPGWALSATLRRFVASAVRRSFIVSSTGCKRMLNFPPKYAHEVRNAVVDFAPALSEGEGLTGQPTVAIMKGDLAVSAARIEGAAVHFTLSGGTAAAKVVQWVEVHCQTDGDQVLEEVVSVTMLS